MACMFAMKNIRILFQGLAANRGVECVDLQGIALTQMGIGHIETCLEDNFYLKRSFHSLQPENLKKIDSPYWSPYESKSIAALLALNSLNRKLVKDEDASLSGWLESVIKSSENESVDLSYFLLRNKPELCMHSHAAK